MAKECITSCPAIDACRTKINEAVKLRTTINFAVDVTKAATQVRTAAEAPKPSKYSETFMKQLGTDITNKLKNLPKEVAIQEAKDWVKGMSSPDGLAALFEASYDCSGPQILREEQPRIGATIFEAMGISPTKTIKFRTCPQTGYQKKL